MPSIQRPSINHGERGMATLITSLALLLAITLLTFAAARVGIMEQRVSANDYRAKQSFEAAQAGIEFAIARIQDPVYKALYIQDDGYGQVDTTTGWLTGDIVDTGANYAVEYRNPITDNFDVIEVTSTGTADGGASQYLAKQIVTFTPCCVAPPAPGNSKGDTEVKGTSRLTNPSTNVTAWAGGHVKKNGDATIATSDPAISGIAKNDTALASLTNDAFFQNFFNGNRGSIKNLSQVYTGDGNYSATLASVTTSKIIWIEGDATINSTAVVGSATAPIVLIVNGKLTINGSAAFNGIAYSTGDMKINGSAQFNGAAISEAKLKLSGNAQVAYDQALINNTVKGTGSFAKISGAWTDLK